MGIFETHAHYMDASFDEDREELLNKIHNEGIEYIVEIGDNVDNSRRAVELATCHDFIYASCGIHPENVEGVCQKDYDMLEELLKNKEQNKIVAIGEIGLDYYWRDDNKEKQKEVFLKQLELALKYDLPVVIHSRDANLDTFEIMKEFASRNGRAIIHCFSGSCELAFEYVKLGMYIGVGGVVTFKNGRKLVEVTKNIDLDHIVIETDSPYLSPEPKRGTRNDSSNLKYIIEKIAEVKNVTCKDVIEATFKNAKEIYGI